MSSPVARVRRAYMERTRQLRMHTQWLQAETAKRAVKKIRRYSQFEPEAVIEAIDRIAEKDPNARFSVGREGSPVIYVETRKPQVVIGVFSSMSLMHKPDELSKASDHTRHPTKRSGHSVVRAWWD